MKIIFNKSLQECERKKWKSGKEKGMKEEKVKEKREGGRKASRQGEKNMKKKLSRIWDPARLIKLWSLFRLM